MKADISMLNTTLAKLDTTLTVFSGKIELLKDNISPKALFYCVVILLAAFAGVEGIKALSALKGF